MEQELPFPYKEGYNFDVEHIRIDLYRLLNQFMAQEKISYISANDGLLYNAIDIVGQYFDVETQRILIAAATISRVIDDSEEQKYRLHNFNTECGNLIKSLSKPGIIENLTLREACNKILHANKYRYDIDQDTMVINPIIYLYGTFNSKKWKATINVIDFVKQYLNNVVG